MLPSPVCIPDSSASGLLGETGILVPLCRSQLLKALLGREKDGIPVVPKTAEEDYEKQYIFMRGRRN